MKTPKGWGQKKIAFPESVLLTERQNPLFNFCVGVLVGGQDAAYFSHVSKDAH